MSVVSVSVTKRPNLARAIRIAELVAIPLSNNLVAFITWRTGLALYPLLAAVLYTYVISRHLGSLKAQFQWHWRSVGLATAGGLALALPALLFFIHPVLVSNVQNGPAAAASVSSVNELLRRLLVDLPFMTAIIEELVFRSLLFVGVGGVRRTVLLNAGLFTVWHVVAGFTAVQATALAHAPLMLTLSYVGALASVFVGGIVFALVRIKTGSFLYSALAHWLTDAIIIVALFGTAHLGW